MEDSKKKGSGFNQAVSPIIDKRSEGQGQVIVRKSLIGLVEP